ncbi:1-deoxy-D-xylulose 5-phosphate reductoisomerase [Labrenzia sp. THAF191b]|uniref:1-deoxy-D-xylulose-5-phosphate reductoisomerase n=1 Tax=unclassified Labrenzia TaxID=2648686 RepID=UPI001268849C|nr:MULTISPECIES: 1-deoxy-D-xylulose-5-phosphate reductoisomerase [unclassified Labrenzia]QFS99696.1 1-deoxy-D-xylulose 5-phosphate reductoisomerase [Labrenzia sp. THAF191b]QFT06010.1 1-deoxy-D-xylulose 5-phosphate reductoisomerase [Labrenzia sp. THAF191a]QFT17554.1 1-deoxy-D-xylulose 5-phosphate reductoisomerase [Labrenzia sp. THAF187b]
MAAASAARGPGAKTRITVLGATGSIGQSLADLIQRNPDSYEVVALVANRNTAGLADMAKALKTGSAILAEETCYPELKERLAGSGIATGAGEAAVLEAVTQDTDIVVGAIVGSAGLKPTMAAIRPGRRIALANKECLVCAGDLFMAKIHATGAELLPVDSEHNAIFQVFETDKADMVEKVILTASGGPFRSVSKADMARVTPQQALKHPNWDMGARITIDSATMMNKGFEVIEASHLFPVAHDQLGVLVHPQSTVHGLVQYKDGSLLAQLGSPDMRTPIAHCLAFPRRMNVPVKRLDLAELGTLTFEAPDLDRFPALRLALEAMRAGGMAPAVLNAADEVAVDAFLKGRIGFMDIPAAIEEVLDAMGAGGKLTDAASVEDVLAIDAEARQKTGEWIRTR